jgi:hypothetical protein
VTGAESQPVTRTGLPAHLHWITTPPGNARTERAAKDRFAAPKSSRHRTIFAFFAELFYILTMFPALSGRRIKGSGNDEGPGFSVWADKRDRGVARRPRRLQKRKFQMILKK